MLSYIVEGGNRLEGSINISGSKNAALPIIAGTILNGKISKLYNVPNINDTQITLKILKFLGCKVKKQRDKIVIDTKLMNKTEIPENLMRQMRSTVVMAGAILGRFKEVTFSYPGGCEIGARPIDLHLDAFKKLGIKIEEKGGFIHCSCDKIIGTGTIDSEGNVGIIGGIKYKLIGAVNNKAKIFLCPKDNYEEASRLAKERNYDIIIKSISTFDEAIKYLKER